MYPHKERRSAERRKLNGSGSVSDIQARVVDLEAKIELVKHQREEFRSLSLDLLSHLEWLYQYADPATHAELRRKMTRLEAAIAAIGEDTDTPGMSEPAAPQ